VGTESENDRDSTKTPKWVWVLGIGGLAFVFSGWGLSWLLIDQFVDSSDRGTFGDMFGAINALFSGLAFGGVIIAILLQRQELIEQRKEIRLATKAQEKSSSALVGQLQLSALSLQATMLRDLEREFNETRRQQDRFKLAAFLLNRLAGEANRKTRLTPDLAEILDFFEAIGLYVKKGALDLEMTWSAFYNWVAPYWQLVHEDVDHLRKTRSELGSKTLWEEVQWLYKELAKYEINREGYEKEPSFSDCQLKQFLNEELITCSRSMNS